MPRAASNAMCNPPDCHDCFLGDLLSYIAGTPAMVHNRGKNVVCNQASVPQCTVCTEQCAVCSSCGDVQCFAHLAAHQRLYSPSQALAGNLLQAKETVRAMHGIWRRFGAVPEGFNLLNGKVQPGQARCLPVCVMKGPRPGGGQNMVCIQSSAAGPSRNGCMI